MIFMVKKHTKKYTEISVRIDNKSVLAEVRDEVANEVRSHMRYYDERVTSLTKDVAQLQKDSASLKTKCNRLESQLKK